MRTLGISILLLASAGAGLAQQWELGGAGGAGFLSNVSVSSPAGAATAGFQNGFAAGAFAGQNLYPHLSGELHYAYLQSNLQIKSANSSGTFSGNAHAIHYDLLLHTSRRGSRTQYFAALGGGLKVFRGTGQPAAFLPMSQFGYFTQTQAMKPMASVGAGMKHSLSPRMNLRVEFRDYITAFPTQLIAPAPGAKYGALLHDFVPMVGVSYVF
ncbi:MAG: outer membrane beta-barrel protein [Acidobacteriia bacterium]|nr:outer membrane beta-barrel protein [Terriglobia bacterium]